MLLDRIGPPGRCRGGVVMIYWFRRPRFTPFCQPYAREGPGRGLPAATGSLANAIGRAKTAPGARPCFSLAFRARAWRDRRRAVAGGWVAIGVRRAIKETGSRACFSPAFRAREW